MRECTTGSPYAGLFFRDNTHAPGPKTGTNNELGGQQPPIRTRETGDGRRYARRHNAALVQFRHPRRDPRDGEVGKPASAPRTGAVSTCLRDPVTACPCSLDLAFIIPENGMSGTACHRRPARETCADDEDHQVQVSHKRLEHSVVSGAHERYMARRLRPPALFMIRDQPAKFT